MFRPPQPVSAGITVIDPAPQQPLCGGIGLATVQLLHRLPTGHGHVDWMIAQDDPARLPLATFRLPRALGTGAATMSAERLPDHRVEYLAYEGTISGNRGTVKRIASGRVLEWSRGTANGLAIWRLRVHWDWCGAVKDYSVRLSQQSSRHLWEVAVE